MVDVHILQLVDLHGNEREWLSEHLGHTLNVHKSHYRLQEPIVEMSHLSRLLIAIGSGRASEFETTQNASVHGITERR